MSTAVNTNILLDLPNPEDIHASSSEQRLLEASVAGPIILSEPVYAELSSRFTEQRELDRLLSETGIRLVPTGTQLSMLPGEGGFGTRSIERPV